MAALGLAGFPDGASSRLPAEQHLVPGVQDHDGVGGGGVGEHLQLLVGVPLEHQAHRFNTALNVSKSSSFFGTRIRTYQPSDWPANKVVL